MYSAKWAGGSGGGVHLFTPEMASTRVDRELFRTTDVPERSGSAVLTLLSDLRHAVNRGELTLVYQPQFRLSTGDLVGFEAWSVGRNRTAACSCRWTSCRWSAATG